MLSPLSLPCLPKDKVVFPMVSSAFVCKIALIWILEWFFRFNYYPKPTGSKITLVEAEWRLSANDHHHHNRRHHPHHHHHYHYGLVRSYMFFLLNLSPQRQLPRLLITGLSFCTSGGSLFFFLRPASSLDVAMDHTIQSHTIRSKAFYSHFQKQTFLVTIFRGKSK